MSNHEMFAAAIALIQADYPGYEIECIPGDGLRYRLACIEDDTGVQATDVIKRRVEEARAAVMAAADRARALTGKGP